MKLLMAKIRFVLMDMSMTLMILKMKCTKMILFLTTKADTTLSKVLPNSDDNPVEYIYTRDSTGRVLSVEARLKVPRAQQTDGKDENENNDHKQESHNGKEQKDHSNNGGLGNDARNTV
jgi:ABC-type Zn2+ transport system substrate-binding protein/surface adhesin